MNKKTIILLLCSFFILTGISNAAEKLKKTSAEIYREKKLREQKEADIKGWALGCGAVLGEYSRERHDILQRNELTDYERKILKSTIAEQWGINDRKSLLETLESLQKGGHSAKFFQLASLIRTLDDQKFNEALQKYKNDPDKAQKFIITKKYYKQLEQKNLLGWDYGRYICLCRWGCTLGYINQDEAWEKIIPAAKFLQTKFDSWEDLGRNYLIGRQFWSYEKTKQEHYQFEDAFQRLLDMQSSPWNKYPWNMDLTLPKEANDPNQSKTDLTSEGGKQ